jgi:hypothetical protein
LLYLEKAEHFEQQLPDDTRAELAKGNKGAFLGRLGMKTLIWMSKFQWGQGETILKPSLYCQMCSF